jgi:(p)ppGpp synthase/HD superfamily hydrolase
MPDQKLVEKAQAFAARVHAGQTQNDAGRTPRFPHFIEVVGLVKESGGSATEIAAAWLHDAVEDTPTTIEEIRLEFGDEVANIVHGLTDPEGLEDLPVAERKAKQAERVRTEGASVRRIKIADQCSNVRSVGRKIFLDMQGERAVLYCQGAKRIADECRGVSGFLDQTFQEIYDEAMQNLSM